MISINVVTEHIDATGGTKTTQYFYDIKNDNVLTLTDVLSKFNISVKDIEDKYRKDNEFWNAVNNEGVSETEKIIYYDDSNNFENLIVKSISNNTITFSSNITLDSSLEAKFEI